MHRCSEKHDVLGYRITDGIFWLFHLIVKKKKEERRKSINCLYFIKDFHPAKRPDELINSTFHFGTLYVISNRVSKLHQFLIQHM